MNDVIQFGESHSVFNRIVLSKESSSNQIKAYFEGVLKLYESNEKFPINLDDVWPLVYAERGVAVRTLRKNFFENEDFISVDKNVKREIGGSTKTDYFLSVSCMEYFIARKVRQVFDVYREVFQKIATGEVQVQQKQLSAVEMFALQAQINLQNEQRISTIEQNLSALMQERQENQQLLLGAEISDEPLPEETEKVKIRKLVDMYIKASGMQYKEVWESIYATLEYRYGNRIKAYKRLPVDRSLLDVAVRNNLGQKVFNVISDMVKSYQNQ